MLIQAFHKFARQTYFVKLWAAPVWVLLGLTKLMIFTLPFRLLASRLGTPQGNQYWVPLLSDTQQRRAQQISRVVQGMAVYTPWNSNCFPQAITARVLLGLYGIPGTLFFGLAKDHQHELSAHAWVVAGQIRVSGGYSFNQFTVMNAFLFERQSRT
ncbi:lasso peptide biosynthesis B2 protein [Celerinatantimonas yamalensis]|uniref:Lasso peptide biosynthesis B2 protein n=1 Tax=Celerinatantimonas yamalensis TaxID=559956 RepID=A0ABW9G5R1_9GAMM